MNKKRISTIVATLVVLVMTFSLLVGCGLDTNFRKKVEKKGWTYSEYGREGAREYAGSILSSKYVTQKVKKAIDKAKAFAVTEKTYKGSIATLGKNEEFEIVYLEFDDLGSANTYYKALKESLDEEHKGSEYDKRKELKKLDEQISKATSDTEITVLNQQRKKLLEDLNDHDDEVKVKKSGKILYIGTESSFKQYKRK